jgi:hypothetical protein
MDQTEDLEETEKRVYRQSITVKGAINVVCAVCATWKAIMTKTCRF